MNWNEVGDWLKTNGGAGAALVGSLLTGNIPGAVAAGVSLVTTATGQATPDAALSQLQREPGTLLRLRELAVHDEVSIREHIRAIEVARLADVADARKMQIDTRSLIPAVLALLVTLGFFGILVGMMTGWLKVADNQALLIMLGALGASWGAVMNFYFGSSKGSDDKNALLARK